MPGIALSYFLVLAEKVKSLRRLPFHHPFWWYFPLVLKFNVGFEQIPCSWLGNTLNNDACTHAVNFLNFCRLFPTPTFDVP